MYIFCTKKQEYTNVSRGFFVGVGLQRTCLNNIDFPFE